MAHQFKFLTTHLVPSVKCQLCCSLSLNGYRFQLTTTRSTAEACSLDIFILKVKRWKEILSMGEKYRNEDAMNL